MTSPTKAARKPHTVSADDPSVELVVAGRDDSASRAQSRDGEQAGTTQNQAQASSSPPRSKWFVILISAMAGLAALSVSLSFTSFVSHVVARDDWIGWLGFGLALIAATAFIIIAVREAIGLIRLSRLSRLRRDVDHIILQPNADQERKVVTRLQSLYAGRADLKWSLARLHEHQQDVRDPGELLHLTERELMSPLDRDARALILSAAKRVTVATAISPMVWIALLYVIAENFRLIRALATLYGARPGGMGALRLARMVFTHILATGGLAMTDDLLGQFLGQDLVRRLSRRLGEGVFNGALTARIGTVAVKVIRPLPFLESEPLRLRDIVRNLVRNTVKPKTA